MEKITKATYKRPLFPNGDKFTMTPARVGHLNEVIEDLNDRIGSPATVTQLTSNDTSVTINSHSGVITMYGPLSPGSASTYEFTVNNSIVTTNSVIMLTIQYGAAIDISDAIVMGFSNLANGSFKIIIKSTGSTAPNAIKIHFLVIS
jgi:hypothetical protein